MNAEVEDQIRAAIRAKAEPLREVQPLRLTTVPDMNYIVSIAW